MYNLIRYYNQNRKKIWGIIIIIASAILALQLVNSYVGEQNKKAQEEAIASNGTENSASNSTASSFNTTGTGVTSTKSAVTGTNVASSSLQTTSDIMDKFVKYCNEKNIEQAYNLLSDDCKEQMYPTAQSFYDNYSSYIFEKGNIQYTMENWAGNTYFVKFKEDMLATGGKSSSDSFSDYITVVSKSGEDKLNINSYVGKTEVNSTTTSDGITVTVVSKNTYMEYEIYNIQVQNNTENDIILDTKESTKSTYIKDSNGAKYVAFLNEVPDNDLYVKNKYTNSLSIKFSNSYSSSRTIKNLVFENIQEQTQEKNVINFTASIR